MSEKPSIGPAGRRPARGSEAAPAAKSMNVAQHQVLDEDDVHQK
jgi:hypothetical protein